MGYKVKPSISYGTKGANGEDYERHADREGAIIALGTQAFSMGMGGTTDAIGVRVREEGVTCGVYGLNINESPGAGNGARDDYVGAVEESVACGRHPV